jgi:hypothetical protein
MRSLLLVAVCAAFALPHSRPAHAGIVGGLIGGAVVASTIDGAPDAGGVTAVVPPWCFRTASEAVFERCAAPFVRQMIRDKACCLTTREREAAIREVHLPLLVKVFRDHKSAAQKGGN